MDPAALTILQQPFVPVALPIIVVLTTLAAWLQNKRFDDMNRRIDEVIQRLDRIETRLENHTDRITRLEVRTALVRRRRGEAYAAATRSSNYECDSAEIDRRLDLISI